MTSRYQLDAIQFPATPFRLDEHTVLLAKRGSEAHGTYIAPTERDAIDDRDVLGVCIPPLDYYFGQRRWEGVEEIRGCWDVVLYPLPKFLSLLTKQNPNVLAMLWLRDEDYLDLSPIGRRLVDAREMFRARRPAYDAFAGYARAQLRRMTHFEFEGYMGAKRKALAEKHGYDCKNAAHLLRLLRMGKEYLSTGRLTVFREHDRDQLIEVKTGKWDLTDVKIEADRLFLECQHAFAESALPEAIDIEAVNHLAVELHRSFFAEFPSPRAWAAAGATEAGRA